MAWWSRWRRKSGGEAGEIDASDFERAFGGRDVTSPAMRRAVAKWYSLYYDESVGKSRDAAQRLPYAIVNKLCKTVFSEYAAGYKQGGAKAAAMNSVLRELDRVKMAAMQQAMIGGECLLKPVPGEQGIRIAVVQRPHYCVLGRDAFGVLTAVGTSETVHFNGQRYVLLERRTAEPDGVRLENRLYLCGRHGELRHPVPLETLPQYAGLQACGHLALEGPGLGLVQLRMPMTNCVDASGDGVSVFEAACGLIETAYRLEAAFEREFRNAASRVIASSDMLVDREGTGPALEDDLFVALDEDPANLGVTVYSPAIREQSFLNRKNDVLRNIESVLGLKRGMLSEANTAERTATEITASAGEYNMTVTALQKAWHDAVVDMAALCDRLGQLYYGWDAGVLGEPVVDFGDGALFDRERVWQEYCTMVQNGWLRPEIALAWYFDMPADSEEELARIGVLMPGKAE